MADEMLAAGTRELKDTPENENPIETVARIYTAMELTRIIMLDNPEDGTPKVLN